MKRYHYMPIRMAKVQNTDLNAVKMWSNKNSHLLPVGMQSGTATSERQLWQFLAELNNLTM